MGVSYFKPHSSYTNGIIKANFVSNQSDEVVVEASSCNPWYSGIYPSAMLTNEFYYQSINEDRTTITITFKKVIFVSHFALSTHTFSDGSIIPPRNWILEGCKENSCYELGGNSDPSFYNVKRMKLSVVQSGVFNKFNFIADADPEKKFFTIQRIEFFGFACDTFSECNGNLLFKTLFYKARIKVKSPFIFTLLS